MGLSTLGKKLVYNRLAGVLRLHCFEEVESFGRFESVVDDSTHCLDHGERRV